jgi:hypothetical protein
MDTDSTYLKFKLKNREFTFDTDVSTLPCGLNGALYFVEMDEDGGMAKYGAAPPPLSPSLLNSAPPTFTSPHVLASRVVESQGTYQQTSREVRTFSVVAVDIPNLPLDDVTRQHRCPTLMTSPTTTCTLATC